MKFKYLITLFSCMMILLTTGGVFAAVLTFDDIVETHGYEIIPNGYGGFDWNIYPQWYRIINGPEYTHSSSGYNNGVVSGEYVAYSVTGTIIAAAGSPEIFDFNGAYLTAGWRNNMDIRVYGYLGGIEQYSTTVTVSTDSPSWFDFNFLGIDRLSFSPDTTTGTLIDAAYDLHPDYNLSNPPGGLYHYAMDNFTFNEDSAPVPEPATMILFGIGLLGLAGISRKKEIAP